MAANFITVSLGRRDEDEEEEDCGMNEAEDKAEVQKDVEDNMPVPDRSSAMAWTNNASTSSERTSHDRSQRSCMAARNAVHVCLYFCDPLFAYIEQMNDPLLPTLPLYTHRSTMSLIPAGAVVSGSRKSVSQPKATPPSISSFPGANFAVSKTASIPTSWTDI
jgi:hypothetical protein